MKVHSTDCRYPECTGMSQSDPDFAARMAHQADVIDGLVPAVSWHDLTPAARSAYREAVEST